MATLALALAAALLCAPASGAQPGAAQARTIALPPQLQLVDLIELASVQAGVSVEYDRALLRGEVALRLERPLGGDELWDLAVSVLTARGFAVVESDVEGVYRVSSASAVRPLSGPIAFAESGGPGPDERDTAGRGSLLSAIVRVRSPEPSALIASMAPLVPSDRLSLQTIGGDGLVLVSGQPRLVERALSLLEALDRPGPDLQRRVVDLRAAQAATVIAVLESVIAQEPTRWDTEVWGFITLPSPGRFIAIGPAEEFAALLGLVEQLDIAEPLTTVTYAEQGVTADELGAAMGALLTPGTDAQIVVEKLTGSVVVRASAEQHRVIEAFLTRLRSSPGSTSRSIERFVIRNRAADDLAATLQSLLDRGLTELGGDDQRGAGDREPPESTITVDPATNSLLIVGPASEVRRLGQLIADLDRRRPQVMLEATLITLTEGESFDLSNELAARFSSGETVFDISSLFGSGLDVDDGIDMASTGLNALVLNPGDFATLTRTVQSVSDGSSLSSPKLLVNDGAAGTISSVNREPFTSINASDTVATTSFGGTEDAGTTISVTPQIAEGDHLVLEYNIELSAFTGDATTTEGDGVVPPPSQRNSISGSVTIPDGFTVVLGGLRTRSEGSSNTGLPGLSQIPLIGWLFGTQSSNESQTRFYVFLTASILRDPLFRDLRGLSDQDLAQAGVDGSLPTLEPIWIR